MNKIGTLVLLSTTLLAACTRLPVLAPNEVAIGNQTWMNHNLKVQTFRNGDSLLKCISHEQWHEAGINKVPAMVYYEFDEAFGADYGALYNAWAIIDPRGLAPEGWHIPSTPEVDSLFGDFALQPAYLSVPGNQLEGSGPWFTKMYTAIEQRDSLGFHAYPAGEIPGYIEALNQIDFNGKGRNTAWWTCTQGGPNESDLQFWNMYMVREGWLHGGLQGTRVAAQAGHYVRCIKD